MCVNVLSFKTFCLSNLVPSASEVKCIFEACVCVLSQPACFFSWVSFLHTLSEGPFSTLSCVRTSLCLLTGLFMLPLGFNPVSFTPFLLPTGRRDRHQVSAANDNICAAVAF